MYVRDGPVQTLSTLYVHVHVHVRVHVFLFLEHEHSVHELKELRLCVEHERILLAGALYDLSIAGRTLYQ